MIKHIWTDGSCLPGGNGGWAVIIDMRGGDELIHMSGGRIDTTNVRMEYQAIIEGLHYMYSNCVPEDTIQVHTDSKIIVDQVNGAAKSVQNAGLTRTIQQWLGNDATPHCTLQWHARNSTEYLRYCDKAAKWEANQLAVPPGRPVKLQVRSKM